MRTTIRHLDDENLAFTCLGSGVEGGMGTDPVYGAWLKGSGSFFELAFAIEIRPFSRLNKTRSVERMAVTMKH